MNRQALLFLTASLFAFTGCDSVESDLPSPDASGTMDLGDYPGTALGTVDSVTTLNGYTIEFEGATPDGGGTRFTYKVTGVEPSPPALDWFFLENACGSEPTALQPSNAAGPAVVNGIDGIKWNASLPPGATRTYSYTFAGDVEVRLARAVISRGGVTEVAAVRGPCGGHYIRGSVFVNADDVAGRSGSELGIGNVLVEVHDGAGLVSTDTTVADGSFEFLLTSGAYTVRVPTSGTDVNALLYDSYNYTGGTAPAELSVALNADVSGKDFGFNPDKQQIIVDLSEGGAYQTEARDVRFWTDVIRKVNQNRPCNGSDSDETTICRAELEGYLAAIFSATGEGEGEYYLLPDPFVMTGTDLAAAAADMLSRPTQTDVAKVSRNLFAMQLNLMKGWGTGSQSYDDALMSYLEEWVRANSVGARASAAVLGGSGDAVKAGGGGGGTIEELRITTTYLGGGGGGTIEE